MTDDDRFEPHPERVRLLREVADDVRGDSSESKQLAAILYRVSDLYDPDEETSPRDIYVNVRNILRIKEQGGRGPRGGGRGEHEPARGDPDGSE